MERLKQHGFGEQLKIVHDSHESLYQIIEPEFRGDVAAIMFNLGYLEEATIRLLQMQGAQ